VTLIATEVAKGITGRDVGSDVSMETILEGLGKTIGAAAFGLKTADLHSSGDEPIFRVVTPNMVGKHIRDVLNRAKDGQVPIDSRTS
jgi:hypothetical protein